MKEKSGHFKVDRLLAPIIEVKKATVAVLELIIGVKSAFALLKKATILPKKAFVEVFYGNVEVANPNNWVESAIAQNSSAFLILAKALFDTIFFKKRKSHDA